MGDLEVLQHRNSQSPSMRHLYPNQTPKTQNLTPPSTRKSYASLANVTTNNNNTSTNNNNYGEKTNMFVGLGRRSCLLAPDSNRVVRVRKTVVFADARGLALTQVRIMSEPSEVPPFWSSRFLSHLIPSRLYDEVDGGYQNETRTQTFRDSWHPRFEQPARDYVAFRRKLEESNVALENIVVRKKDDGSCSGGNENKAVGTVKVRNLDYHKDVIIRYTTDGWKTYKDETCSHVPTSASAKTGPSSAFHLHDTFRFELLLPTVAKSGNPSAEKSGNTEFNSISTQLARMTLGDDRNLKNSDAGVVFCDRVEFCLRFRCAGGEYWDNNSGRNYVIQRRQQNVITMSKLADSPKASDKVREATYASMNGGSWSEFASWQHLDNNCPYW